MKDETRIVVVLDRSGSMNVARETTVKGFNDFIRVQKAAGTNARVKLVQFDDQYEVVFDKPISDVKELTQIDFVPRGGTALLDAQGRSITELGAELASIPESERPNKVIFVTLTDGYENASKEYTRDRVKTMTEHQRSTYNWEFVFLGANQDAIQTAATIGILREAALTYSVADPLAYHNAIGALSKQVVKSRSMRGSVSFSDQERSASI